MTRPGAIPLPEMPRALATILLVALGLVAVVWLVQPRPPGSGALGCLPADTAIAPTPVRGTATGSGPAAALARAWTDAIDLPGGTWTGQLRDLEIDMGRAVAVGSAGSVPSRGLVAVTDDGRLWSRAPGEAPVFDRADIVDIVTAQVGFVAVGSRSVDDAGRSEGMTWTSTDGNSWVASAHPDVAYLGRVAVRGDELIALASTQGGASMLGRSRDGQAWGWEPWPTRGWPADIASTGDGWIVGGSIGPGADDAVPVLWRSADGLRWTCQVIDTPPATQYGSISRILPGARTTLILGGVAAHCGGAGSCPGYSAAWTAGADGAWVPAPEGGPIHSRVAVVTPAGGFLAVTSWGMVASDDGAARRVVAALPVDAGPMALAVAPFGLVGVGETSRDGTPQAWVGLLPAE